MARKFILPKRSGPRRQIDFAGELNAQQEAAVTSGEGPKLVIAGAGTGKTRTLTYRVAWLLSQGIAPESLLLATFTNKAAREMVDRVARLTGMESSRLWAGTFHSVGARLLRRHGSVLGYTESFSILDESDQRDMLRLCITDVGIQVERKRFPSPKVLASLASARANRRMDLASLIEERYPRFADWEEQISAVCDRYTERKRLANAMDYDDLLVLWLKLLREAPEVRRHYGEQFRYILVDEYQDTNLIQGEVVEELASENGGNLMVVGDDCQSIYAFRGAHYDNILSFPDRNPGAEVFKLEINYRSTPQILAVANSCIRCNAGQYQKELVARVEAGSRPALVPCNYPEQEATFVAERILQLRDEGTPLREIAVLYRAHAHRLSVETTLLRYDIPYEVRGGLRFFEQAHVKDVTAHLRVIENPRDEIAFRRALLLRPGIGNVTARRVWGLIGDATDFDEMLSRMRSDKAAAVVGKRGREGWRTFTAALTAIAECREAPESAVRAVLERGYADTVAVQFPNHESRLEDLDQLAIFAAQYDTLGAFLEELVLLGEMYGQDVEGGGDGDERGVVLSTVHQAKGLEWDVVFLIHLAEGAMPSPRGLDDPDGEEEERRIFYVALTRARRELYLSYPIVRPGGMGGSLLQQPSRFLQELPQELMELWEIFDAPATDAQIPLSTPATGQRGGSPFDFDPNVDPTWDDEDFPQ
jgi:DNA helicase-2/ATP-dependent DNA helicase PcrA